MPMDVLLSAEAEKDLEEIWHFILARDNGAAADRVLDGLETAIAALAEFPERGNFPKELLSLGLREFREVHFKPWRVVYRVLNNQVVVYCVLDGRRDMPSQLHRRLVR
jgi:toxin ParE1/3/4